MFNTLFRCANLPKFLAVLKNQPTANLTSLLTATCQWSPSSHARTITFFFVMLWFRSLRPLLNNIECFALPVILILFHQPSVVGDDRVGIAVRRWVSVGVVAKARQHRRNLVYITTHVRWHELRPPAECFHVHRLYHLIRRLLHSTNTDTTLESSTSLLTLTHGHSLLPLLPSIYIFCYFFHYPFCFLVQCTRLKANSHFFECTLVYPIVLYGNKIKMPLL